MSHPGRLLFVNQTYPPDPAAVGQHVADAAGELARRGWAVTVYAASRGYDDPSVRYPPRESANGVDVVRLALSSFGKGSIAIRLVAQTLYLVQSVCRALLLRDLRCVVITTNPHTSSWAGWAISMLRRVPVVYWVMDLNPDQIVALGKVRPDSMLVRTFDGLNRLILKRARTVVVLDRFMAARVLAKADVADRLVVIPPWPLGDRLRPNPASVAAFRAAHGLEGKFVVMYSGNHSPANPLDTLLAAAAQLSEDPRFAFVFIGGGQGKRDVEEAIAHGARNLSSLPYQPLERLGDSLSAADVHVVSLGSAMAGVVHPCKVYGAMAVARPVLGFGPPDCHLADLQREFDLGAHVEHGDVDGAVKALRALADAGNDALAAMGWRGARATEHGLGQARLRAALCDVVEQCAMEGVAR